MRSERPDVDAALDRIIVSHGYDIRHRPDAHAGGKWLSRFASALGGNASLEIDGNYLSRQPLFGTARLNSRSLAGMLARGVLVLNIHEIVAGKINALFERNASRDLFDARQIMSTEGLDWKEIKAAVLAIDASGRRDWRAVSVNSIEGDPREFRWKFATCLTHNRFGSPSEVAAWIEETVVLCRERFAYLLDLTDGERAFLDGLLDRGEIGADLLDVAPEVPVRIGIMPMLAKKARHVREHRALDA